MSLLTRSGAGRATAVVAVLAAAGLLSASPSSASTRDGDHDGMPNRWEIAHHLNPRVANARGDADHDGLRNLAEFRHHSNPRQEDTDRDGDDDGDEVRDGTATTNVLLGDTDHDGRRDGDE